MEKSNTPKPRSAWSGNFVPHMHQRVNVHCNGLGPGRITDFFFEEDHEGTLWQGVEVRLEDRPDWHKRQRPNDPIVYVFGLEVSLIEEGASA